ncbi:MAG: hypothetical protein UY07_C0007G0045 [Parcubacteria group bacterium GW2011_GWA1_47_8]|nr:MAG: hypothetical protein UY07_C0007G0045 [Parcubacteria group bacterium GW2011_GWA1_47_8]KKW07641.1 MAG: hypothetical protein UY42_C0009G0014 [Parcubacteria group bacterium GW2011_GWA2_49_16]
MGMNISAEVTIPLRAVSVADTKKLFHPADAHARRFLQIYGDKEVVSCPVEYTHDIDVATFSICSTTTEESLQELSAKIHTQGWHFGSIADWYQYIQKNQTLTASRTWLLGTIYHDEEYHEWFPIVTPRTKKPSPLSSVALRNAIANMVMRLRLAKQLPPGTEILLVKMVKKSPQK